MEKILNNFNSSVALPTLYNYELFVHEETKNA